MQQQREAHSQPPGRYKYLLDPSKSDKKWGENKEFVFVVSRMDPILNANEEKIGAFLVEESLDAENSLSLSCLLYTSPSPRDRQKSRMPSSA